MYLTEYDRIWYNIIKHYIFKYIPMSEDFFELSIFYLLQDDYICMYILAPKKIEESFITIYFGRTSLFYIWGLLCVYIYIYVCAFVWLYECIYGMYHYVFMYVCVSIYIIFMQVDIRYMHCTDYIHDIHQMQNAHVRWGTKKHCISLH